MRSLLLGTRNPGKVKEITSILADAGWSYSSLLEFPSVAVAEENFTTYSENAIAKARFAFDLEDRRDRHAEARLELVIGIDEALRQPSRELTPERGLARAHHADEKQIAPVQRHRGIVMGSEQKAVSPIR